MGLTFYYIGSFIALAIIITVVVAKANIIRIEELWFLTTTTTIGHPLLGLESNGFIEIVIKRRLI